MVSIKCRKNDLKHQLPEERLDIKIRVIDDETRVLVFTPYGQQYEELCEAVL